LLSEGMPVVGRTRDYLLDSPVSIQVCCGGSCRPAGYYQVPRLTKRLHLVTSLSCNNHSDTRDHQSSLQANGESIMSAALMHKSALPEFWATFSWLGVKSALKARGRASGQLLCPFSMQTYIKSSHFTFSLPPTSTSARPLQSTLNCRKISLPTNHGIPIRLPC
jgi:hypothetical protein